MHQDDQLRNWKPPCHGPHNELGRPLFAIDGADHVRLVGHLTAPEGLRLVRHSLDTTSPSTVPGLPTVLDLRGVYWADRPSLGFIGWTVLEAIGTGRALRVLAGGYLARALFPLLQNVVPPGSLTWEPCPGLLRVEIPSP